jgi:23S rRNA pseudouridine2605 synthase
LTHPRYHLPKIYQISILGKVPVAKIIAIRQSGAKAEVVGQKLNQTIVKITLYQGKKRQIRLLCASLHLHLTDLHRLSIGPINIGDLAPGKYRPLTPAELKSLI